MSLADALDIQTTDEVRTETAAELDALGVDDVGFPLTSTPRKLLDSHAASLARLSQLRAQATKAGSVELIQEIAEEDGRDAWIEHFSEGHFGLPRDPSTFAEHRLVLVNVASGIERTIDPLKLRARGGGVDFINQEGGVLPPGGALSLVWKAQTAGSIGNVVSSLITQLVTAIAGVSIDGEQGEIVIAARDPERNDSLLERGMARWGASSAGGARGSIVEWIDEAFKYAGRPKTVTKWGIDDENPYGGGSTGVYLGTDAGPATADDVAIVDQYLQIRRTAGTGLMTVEASIPVALMYTATISANVPNAAALLTSVDTSFTADLPIGGIALEAELIRRIKNALGLKTSDNVVTTFVDTQLQPFQQGVFAGTLSVS
jgi:uncharacterized phage protein gp47/JayE